MKRATVLPDFQLIAFSILSATITLTIAPSAKAVSLNPVSLASLPGLINTNNVNGAGSAVYRANLAEIGDGYNITSITLTDMGLPGGSAGKFSGFDLDAIRLSYEKIDNAEDLQNSNIAWLDVFDFTPIQTTASGNTSAGTIFTPGTQRDTTKPGLVGDLFGTDGQGNIDNHLATLDEFDALAIADQRARGFVSIGLNGKITFNLKNIVGTGRPIYLYLTEVGGNAEKVKLEMTTVANSVPVPEPSTLGGVSLMGIYLKIMKKKKTKR